MAYRTSISGPALLALLGSCIGLAGPLARGGDRIEFSAPTALMDVPQQEREVKQDTTSSVVGAFQTPGVIDPAFMPPTQIIIPPQMSRNQFGWQSPFQEDEKANDDSGLDLFAQKSELPTNRFSSSLQRESRDDTPAEFGPGSSSFDRDSSERDSPFGRDRYSARQDDRNTWSFISHGPIAEERMREGEFIPDNAQFNAPYGQPPGGFSMPNSSAQSDPLHASAFSSGSSLENDNLRNDGVPQQYSMPPSMRAWDVPTTAPLRRSQAEQEALSAQRRTPSAPAILAFPRMPGTLNPD